MKGWSAAFLALSLGAAPAVLCAAGDVDSAARELARKTVATAGRNEPVTVIWRDLSSLGPAALGQARAAFEAGLREGGARLAEAPVALEAQITLSENASQYLLVEEIRKGDERQVWMAVWGRAGAPAANASAGTFTLQSRLIWEQDEQMLDVAVNGDTLWVLSGASLTVFDRSGGGWRKLETMPVPTGRPWPRDLRGRLRLAGDGVQVRLPGLACEDRIGAHPVFHQLPCNASADPWTFDSGAALLLASFASGRNYFDGRVVAQSGARRTVPPFYSAAAFEDSGQTVWLLALTDGTAGLFDASLEPAGVASGAWGSDVAGADLHCGGRALVLASRPGDWREPDGLRALTLVDHAAVAVGEPAEFPGAITALWPTAGGATAVVKNAATGRYQAYAVTVSCSQ